MSSSLLPPLSFATRFRPCAGGPGRAAARRRTLALYLSVGAVHVSAAVALAASARSPQPRSESTLAVEWLVEAPTRPTEPPPRQPATPPRRAVVTPTPMPTPPAPAAAPAVETAPPAESTVAPAQLAPPVAPPTAAPSHPPTAVADAPAAASRPAPVEAPRYDADYLQNPAPAYPPLSRRLGEEGRVLLRAEVGADGRARQVEVARSSGSPRLDAAAADAVRRWRFQPARQGGQVLAGWVQIPIKFRLDN